MINSKMIQKFTYNAEFIMFNKINFIFYLCVLWQRKYIRLRSDPHHRRSQTNVQVKREWLWHRNRSKYKCWKRVVNATKSNTNRLCIELMKMKKRKKRNEINMVVWVSAFCYVSVYKSLRTNIIWNKIKLVNNTTAPACGLT